MTLRCTDHLIQEHRMILRAIYVLKAMAERARDLKLPDPGDVAWLLGFFKGFADEHHQVKEEAIFFPALKKTALGKTAGQLNHLVAEHEQERSIINGLQDAMRTRDFDAFAYFGGRFAEVLANHIYKEDHILFELAEKEIPAAMDAAVTEEMERFDRRIETEDYDDLFRSIVDLEWKYLRKAA
jgi:hemerythrin-like domain-containing protein